MGHPNRLAARNSWPQKRIRLAGFASSGEVRYERGENDERQNLAPECGSPLHAYLEPAGNELTSINIDSAVGIFTGDAAQNLGGSFDNDIDSNIFKATFGSSFGSISFGNVAQAGLSVDFVLGDLTVVGSLAGGGDLGAVDLIYVPVPEPSTMATLLVAFVTLGWFSARMNPRVR